jgi:pimeloyl-ACP methyl ester carboxylesterase
MSDHAIEFADIEWAGRAVRIEHAWLGRERTQAPLVVFLHEGLGSLSMWKDFPQAFCDAAGVRGLVYSRPGYGRSTPRPPDERWALDFLHRQAFEVLPALLAALGVREAPWLFGHSDGGSIALLHAGRRPTAGLVVLAPHIFVEEFGLASIRKARAAYLDPDDEFRAKLARHHTDVDSAFWGWNDIWLDPTFPRWNIESELASIRCPLLAVQGVDDPYGTLAQVHGIQDRVAETRLLVLPDCGHSPHRDRPDALTHAAASFIAQHQPTELPQETHA